MRPLRLTITAFGPYAGIEVVEFDALADLGLFVVAGNNGSGKSTIFDALHYSLFGTLPGTRSEYSRLRSDHAAPNVECRVVFDFVSHGERWRVERSPKQSRPKRRGTGTRVVENRASISRFDGGQPNMVANRINEVNEKCIELVGLTGRQFERVALLPQGEFSRALRESGTERRTLLRALFSAEVFGDAAALLAERASTATATAQKETEHLERQVQSVATAFAELSGAPVGMSSNELAAAIDAYRTGPLVDIQQHADQVRADFDEARGAHQSAVEVASRVARRLEVDAAWAQHRSDMAQHERDRGRLDAARAAVPVVGQARAAAEQADRLAQSEAEVDRLADELTSALRSCGLEPPETISPIDVDTWGRRLRTRADDVERLCQLRMSISTVDENLRQLMGDQRRIADRLATCHREMTQAQTAHRQATTESEELSSLPDVAQSQHLADRRRVECEQITELARLRANARERVGAVAELDARNSQAEQAYQQALAAQQTRDNLDAAARTALQGLAEAERRLEAGTRYDHHRQQLVHLRSDLDRAHVFANDQWDAYIGGTAVRVAEALVEGERCPVCGSAEHPEPAATRTDRGQQVSNDDVIAARARVQELLADCHRSETEVEKLKARDPDIGSSSAVDLTGAITVAKQRALTAANEAERAAHAASMVEQCRRELGELRAEHQRLVQQTRLDDRQTNQLIGALGELADATIDQASERSAQAEQALKSAGHAADRLLALNHQIEELVSRVDRIGLDQIDAEARQVALETQAKDRERERRTLLDDLDVVADQLGMSDHTAQSMVADELESLRHLASHGDTLFGDLQTARARLDETTTAKRRADSTLASRLDQSPFESVHRATDAFEEPHIIEQLELTTTAYVAAGDRLAGQLEQLTDVPKLAPDVPGMQRLADELASRFEVANRRSITMSSDIDRLHTELRTIGQRQVEQADHDGELRRLERVAALVKGDNDRNTSLENWVLAAHLRDVVELANIRLARSTQQRFQLCVLDDGENRRGRWGLDLGVEDTVTGTRRPTAGLSGGELFQASLALALGLADAVMSQSAGVHIDALFIDEGFGSLDESAVERAIDLLDELRGRGAMVGVITHVPALLDALPRGITVEARPDGTGSTIRQRRSAA